MVENGEFTWTRPFWEQPAHRWRSMMDAGVRAAFVCSSYATPGMIAQGRGLIVNISFWAARHYLGNAIYGMAKAATDKMTAHMAHELRPPRRLGGVAVPRAGPHRGGAGSRPGWLARLSNSESPEFIGRVIAALADDPTVAARSGQVLVAAALALEYGVADSDGRRPVPPVF